MNVNRWPVLVLIGLSLLLTISPATAQDTPAFPTDGWSVSTPEAQGMDSLLLAQMLEAYVRPLDGPDIHNILIIRNGQVVLDASVPPYSSDLPHALYSVTKLLASTLAGAAQERGFIAGPDQSIWDFFNPGDYANMNDDKMALTLRNFMTQRSGLSVSPSEDLDVYALMDPDADWVQSILDSRMVAAPGAMFSYTDSNAYIVNAAIQQATGMPVQDFAEETLFGPLGITDYEWATSPQGIAWGGDGLQLSPHDLAKIGYLYLQNGTWDGQQILSPEWIEAAWTDAGRGDFFDGYGFFWWVDETQGSDSPVFLGVGLEGQFLAVYPEHDLIVVTNGDVNYMTPGYVHSHIVRAIQSDEPITADPASVERLQAAISAFANPQPVAASPVPEAALAMSGMVFALPDNADGWETASLDFGEDETVLTLGIRGEKLVLPVGMDGLYRRSEDGWPLTPLWQYMPDIPLYSRGQWINDELHIRIRSERGLQEYNLVFKDFDPADNSVMYRATEVAGVGMRRSGRIHAVDS